MSNHSGRVIQVSTSSGGVPKRAVERAWIGRLGLIGDAHREDTVHGGPLRAVCLIGTEVLERLRAEGHPVRPGSVGENLTTSGIEWSTLPVGTRLRVGAGALLEITAPAMPCDTQRPNFRDGLVNRISIVLHPADSRMYARVLEEGEARPGDAITLLPPEPTSDAPLLKRLERHDSATAHGYLALWRAAQSAGYDVAILNDGELLASASHDLPSELFNDAVTGLRTLPHLLPRVLDHYRTKGVPGLVDADEAPWPGAEAAGEVAVLAADAGAVRASRPPEGVTIRAVPPDAWERIRDVAAADSTNWERILPFLLGTGGVTGFVAEEGGRPIGAATLVRHRKVGSLVMGLVHPDARGRGIQRALIAARAEAARADGCDLLVSEADADTVSERNLSAMGFERLRVRHVWRFDPAADPAPALTERGRAAQ